jgi:hypothetical protein
MTTKLKEIVSNKVTPWAGEASIALTGEESVGAFARLGEGGMIFIGELQILTGGRY